MLQISCHVVYSSTESKQNAWDNYINVNITLKFAKSVYIYKNSLTVLQKQLFRIGRISTHPFAY